MRLKRSREVRWWDVLLYGGLLLSLALALNSNFDVIGTPGQRGPQGSPGKTVTIVQQAPAKSGTVKATDVARLANGSASTSAGSQPSSLSGGTVGGSQPGPSARPVAPTTTGAPSSGSSTPSQPPSSPSQPSVPGVPQAPTITGPLLPPQLTNLLPPLHCIKPVNC